MQRTVSEPVDHGEKDSKMDDEQKAKLQRLNENIAAAMKIDRKVLAAERDLMHTKWFAYRFISPAAATRMFALAYSKACQRAVRRERDVTLVVNGVKWSDFTHTSR